MKYDVFVYGTLLVSEIVKLLTGKNFHSQKAILQDYRRYKIYDGDVPRMYPAIVEEKGTLGSLVEGKILFDLDEESMEIFDAFEDKEYKKIVVHPISDGKRFDTYCYIWDTQQKHRLKDEWNMAVFKKEDLSKYLERVQKFVESFKAAKNYTA